MVEKPLFQSAGLGVCVAAVAGAIYFELHIEPDTPAVTASQSFAVSSGNAVVTGDNASANIGGTQTNQGSNND
ncbi:MAG: hypothetical protein AAGD13_00035 [Pseudomonadota bacterium]